MAKIYLVNVGANTSHRGKARSPIFADGTWVFVPFPRKHADQQDQRFPAVTRPYVHVRDGVKCHLDPDWQNLTYGDCCEKPRARSLLKVQEGEGDILLFWALLWKTGRTDDVFSSGQKGWYVIGAMRIEHILRAGQKIDVLRNVSERVACNAHVNAGVVRERPGERVFIASANHRYSRRFTKAVDWQVKRDDGLMRRVVRSSSGELLEWKKQPRWYCVTRACRAILDLSDKQDRDKAKLLASRIESENNGFDLIGAL